jgi:hypothetical protein
MWAEMLAGAAGGGGGGSGSLGGGYGGSSSITTPIETTAQGGTIGAQSFDFRNNAFAPSTNWTLIVAGACVVAWFIWGRK